MFYRNLAITSNINNRRCTSQKLINIIPWRDSTIVHTATILQIIKMLIIAVYFAAKALLCFSHYCSWNETHSRLSTVQRLAFTCPNWLPKTSNPHKDASMKQYVQSPLKGPAFCSVHAGVRAHFVHIIQVIQTIGGTLCQRLTTDNSLCWLGNDTKPGSLILTTLK